ncbi:hypothetical protein [Aureimonas jatrophae]|uniref:Uncharacterized protein n=1 Tax=Aureimonas jatrophae TaxID=1166073 RepID=A0A1H0DC45_9HYPH|nr:hypothetical protein [Aureimonas jatrophae]MBB3951814.1 hypothetical protein [Aureimonas jatrophae]SDN67797.1 hypothetical protein SAMN05192530_101706 [Aureimonas jatrophae]
MSGGPTRRDVLAGGAALAAGLALPGHAARADARPPLFVLPEPLTADQLWLRLGAPRPAGLVLVAEGAAPAQMGLSCLSPRALASLGERAGERLLPFPAQGLHLAAPARPGPRDEAAISRALVGLLADGRAAPHAFALALRDRAAGEHLAALLDASGSPRALRIL